MLTLKNDFTKDQLVIVVNAILLGALDRIQDHLPTEIQCDRTELMDGEDIQKLSWDEQTALDTAGTVLGILAADLTDEGLSAGDALVCADNFGYQCENLIHAAWDNAGTAFRELKYNLTRRRKTPLTLNELYSPFFPDTKRCAEDFVNRILNLKP